ncbi:hypothetical protein T03_17583 [Trichinella britovi]|uniref:Uncharacterized protein n=1 Tax=Trichinella britovi TaxID=45882 RepID=A0A0V1D3Y5_TRIBR|nr:hypothetical protein T03_17583 [Trichinella britovi]
MVSQEDNRYRLEKRTPSSATNILEVELYSSHTELPILEKLLACENVPVFFHTVLPEERYLFSYFNQAEDHAHSRIPPLPL